MIKIANLLAVAFFLLLSGYAVAQTNDEAGKKIDALFASYTAHTPGAAVAIVKSVEAKQQSIITISAFTAKGD